MANRLYHMASNLRLRFHRGDTFIFKLQLQDTNNNPLTLGVDDKLFLTVKEKNNNTVKVQLTLKSGITFADDYYIFTFKDTDTDDLDFKDYIFDIELVTTERHITLAMGTLTIMKEVTFKIDEGEV